MSRLKILGLAVSIAAVMAVAASVAWAQKIQFHAEAGATKTTLLADGPLLQWEFDFGPAECEEESGEGEVVEEAEEEEIDLILSKCSLGEAPIKIDFNGCEIGFKAETLEKGNYEGSMRVACAAGKVIEFTAHPDCTIRVTPQIGLKKVTFKTIGFNQNQEVTVDLDVGSLAYEEKGALCANPGKMKNNGTVVGAVRLTAEDGAGNMKGYWVA